MTTLPYSRIFVYDYCGEFGEFAIDNFIVIERNTTGFEKFMVDTWEQSKALAARGGKSLLILDEIAVYGRDNPQIDHAYRLSRHVGLDIVGISQRFFSLPVITRSQSDIFHVFSITELRDLQYIRGVVGDEIATKIQNLQMFEYLSISL